MSSFFPCLFSIRSGSREIQKVLVLNMHAKWLKYWAVYTCRGLEWNNSQGVPEKIFAGPWRKFQRALGVPGSKCDWFMVYFGLIKLLSFKFVKHVNTFLHVCLSCGEIWTIWWGLNMFGASDVGLRARDGHIQPFLICLLMVSKINVTGRPNM